VGRADCGDAMNEPGDSPSQELPSGPEPFTTPESFPPELPPEPTEAGIKPLFSIELTVVSVLLAMLCQWRAVTYYTENTPLDQLEQPVKLVVRVVERDLDFVDATTGVGGIPRWIYRLTRNTKAAIVENAQYLYDNVLRHGRYVGAEDRAWLQAHYSVLLGEAGETNLLAQVLEASDPPPLRTNFVDAVRRIYLKAGSSASASRDPPALILESLTPGWAHDKLAARLAREQQDMAEAQALEAGVRARGAIQQRRALVCYAVQAGFVLIAITIVAWAVWRRKIPWRGAKEESFSPWPIQDAIAVVALADVAATVLSWTTGASPFRYIVQPVYLLQSLVPLVLLTHLCLVKQRGLSWRSLLVPERATAEPETGANAPATTSFPRITPATVLAYALALTGLDMAVWWALYAIGGTGHWAEGMDETLMFGSSAVRLAAVVNASVFGPIFEELFYRVLLYGALRMRFRVMPAACLSSFLFAATHLQYSLPGILAVFLFGVACALAYERTRSLVVVMVAHGLTNLLITCMDIMLTG